MYITQTLTPVHYLHCFFFLLQLVHRQVQLSCTIVILTRARTWIEQTLTEPVLCDRRSIHDLRSVTLKVVDGTEPTLSMPMLVVNGHGLVYRGEDTVLCTAAREIVGPHVTNALRVGFDA